MAKFQKWHGKKRNHRKEGYTDRVIRVAKGSLIDKELGYDIPNEYYEAKCDPGKTEEKR